MEYMGALYQPLQFAIAPTEELIGIPDRPDIHGTVLVIRLAIERRSIDADSSETSLGTHQVALHFRNDKDLLDWIHQIEKSLKNQS